MELLFFILKIILIVLLGAIGLVLFLLCMILFVPIHYEVSGTVTEAKELSFKGKITYCLSIVKLLVSYQDGQTDMQISLFGFRKKRKEESVDDKIMSDKVMSEEIVAEETVPKEIGIEGEESNWEAPETQEETKILEETDTSEENVFEEKEVVSDEAEPFTETQAVEETLDKDVLNQDLSEQDFSNELEDSAQTDKKKSKKKRRKKRHKKKRVSKERVSKEKVLKEKKESKFNFAFIKQQLTDENNHYVVKKIWAEAGYLLKHFGLRKIQTDLVFSAGDPALTGQILGILCIMPVLYRYEFGLVPDFEAEEVYIKGTFLVAGRIRLIHVCITAVRLVLDKKVRLVTKNLTAQFRTQ